MPAIKPEGGGDKSIHVRASANDTTAVHGNYSFSTPHAAHNATSGSDVRSSIANSGTPTGIQSSSKAQAPKDYHGMSAADTAMLASNFIPGAAIESAAAKVAKYAAEKAAAKMAPKAAKVVEKTFKQGGKTKIEVTPPKKTGAGPSSPVKKTEVKVQQTKKGASPLQQATGARESARAKTKTNVKLGTRASGTYVIGKAQGKNEQKKNDNNKKGK